VPALSGLLNLSRTKSIKPVFHVPIFETSIQENCLGDLGFRIKTLKVTNLVISTPLASSGVKSNQQSILNYPVSFSTPPSTVNSQQSTIIPVQPELILLTLVNWCPIRTLHTEPYTLNYEPARLILKHHNAARIASYPNLISFRIVSNSDRT
jgi:hypothetical protein